MKLSYSIRETGKYNSFVVVKDGQDVSNELELEKAADLIRRFENASVAPGGRRLSVDDMPAILAALAGTAAVDAKAASDAHTWRTCPTHFCNGNQTRTCKEFQALWDEALRLRNWTTAPIATINRWGVRHGHLNMASALAEIGLNGGGLIKAPEGAYETELAAQAERKVERDAAQAARRATRGGSNPLPRSRRR